MATVTQLRGRDSPYATFRLRIPEDPIAMEQRVNRQRASGQFPQGSGPYDIPSFQEKDEAFFRKYSDKGERRADAPRRQNTPVVDPVSGFTSVGADAEDGNYKTMEPLVNPDHRPQSAKPYGRPITSPIPDLRSQNAPWETRNKGKAYTGICLSVNTCIVIVVIIKVRSRAIQYSMPSRSLSNHCWGDFCCLLLGSQHEIVVAGQIFCQKGSRLRETKQSLRSHENTIKYSQSSQV